MHVDVVEYSGVQLARDGDLFFVGERASLFLRKFRFGNKVNAKPFPERRMGSAKLKMRVLATAGRPIQRETAFCIR